MNKQSTRLVKILSGVLDIPEVEVIDNAIFNYYQKEIANNKLFKEDLQRSIEEAKVFE
jgi:hypothetical protein